MNPSSSVSKLTESVIGCAFGVYNQLGFGFLESVYEKSLIIELRKHEFEVHSQEPIQVHYDGHVVGDFYADLMVEGRLIVELKSVVQLANSHEIQLVNYLTVTGIEDGLLINFGPEKVEVKRKFRTYLKSC